MLAPALVNVDLGAAGRRLVAHLADAFLAQTSKKCSTEVAFARGFFKYSLLQMLAPLANYLGVQSLRRDVTVSPPPNGWVNPRGPRGARWGFSEAR